MITDPKLLPLRIIMANHILYVLDACHGNKSKAAEILDISRSSMYRMFNLASQYATYTPQLSQNDTLSQNGTSQIGTVTDKDVQIIMSGDGDLEVSTPSTDLSTEK